MRKRRPKIRCEICDNRNIEVLERHHIIPRTDPLCTNDDMNIAILCSNCHSLLHAGKLKIIGVFPSTDPSGVSLIYELDGKRNLDVDEPYFVPKPKTMKIYFPKEENYGREDGQTTGDEQETNSTK